MSQFIAWTTAALIGLGALAANPAWRTPVLTTTSVRLDTDVDHSARVRITVRTGIGVLKIKAPLS